jgi:hypothetical protein
MSNYVVGLMKSIPAGAVALALLFAGPAQAGPRNPALVAHNGSLMSVRTVGRELMEIRYV